jgi:dTMP kinase
VLTAEPTDGPIGSAVRARLKSDEKIDPLELQKLFSEDRAWHMQHVIQPALHAGKIVITDRYIASTLIYGEALGVPLEKLKDMNNNFIQPDLEFVLLPPYEVCRERVNRREAIDQLEGDALQKKVYEGYTQYSKSNALVCVIDSSGPKDATASSVYQAFHAHE